MTSTEELALMRASLKSFVLATWDADDQERMDRIGDLGDARPLNQERLIDLLSEGDLRQVACIAGLILRDRVRMMDKDSMALFWASGLYLTETGQVVLFHER